MASKDELIKFNIHSAILKSSQLSPSCKNVWYAIFNHLENDSPNVRTIANDVNMKIRSVQRCMNKLIDYGALTIVRKDGQLNQYILNKI